MAGGGTDRNVNAKQLGYMLGGISERRVQQLAAEGVVRKEARGRYNLVESVRGYCQYLQDVNAGKDTDQSTDFGDAKSQKMRADADRSIMEAAQLAGQLVPTDIVAYHWNHMIGAFRSKMLNLPKRVAPMVQNETTFAKCRKIIADAISECLVELSEYEPPGTHFRNLDALLSRTSAGADGKRVGRGRKTSKSRK